MDHQRAYEAARILRGVMRVIPRTPVQRRHELIREALPRRHGTLRHRGRAVLPGRSLLEESVPVQRRAFFRARDVVMQSHLDGVTPVGLDQGAGKGAIDQEDVALVAIGGNDAAANGEVVGP